MPRPPYAAGLGEREIAALAQLLAQLRRHRPRPPRSASPTARPRRRRRRRSPPSAPRARPRRRSRAGGSRLAGSSDGLLARSRSASAPCRRGSTLRVRSRSTNFWTFPRRVAGHLARSVSSRSGQYCLATLEPVEVARASRRGRSRRPPVEDREGAGALAEALIGHRDDRHLLDTRRVAVQQLLDLGDRHLLAAAVDDVLDAPGDAQVAGGVDRREVAGAVPAVGRESPRPSGRDGRGSARTGSGCDLEVALLARAEHLAVVVDDAQPHARERPAVGAPDLAPDRRRGRPARRGRTRSSPRRRRRRRRARAFARSASARGTRGAGDDEDPQRARRRGLARLRRPARGPAGRASPPARTSRPTRAAPAPRRGSQTSWSIWVQPSTKASHIPYRKPGLVGERGGDEDRARRGRARGARSPSSAARVSASKRCRTPFGSPVEFPR